MGFKIWRKDKFGWCLAFDAIFNSQEAANARIAELQAAFHDMISLGELSFYPYRDDIKLDRDGSIIDNNLPIYKQKRSRPHNKFKRR